MSDGRWKRGGGGNEHGHEHKDGEECGFCKHGPEHMRRWEEKCMADVGWYAHYVGPQTGGAPGFPFESNLHTHGIPVTWPGAMDAQMCLPPNVDPKLAHGFFVGYVDLLKEGFRFRHGDSCARVIQRMDVCFARATEHERDVLRIILPDRDGHLIRSAMRGYLADQWEGADPVEELRTIDVGPGSRKPRAR